MCARIIWALYARCIIKTGCRNVRPMSVCECVSSVFNDCAVARGTGCSNTLRIHKISDHVGGGGGSAHSVPVGIRRESRTGAGCVDASPVHGCLTRRYSQWPNSVDAQS